MPVVDLFKSLVAVSLLATPAVAQDEDGFVEANILGIFYHELGHAIVDIQQVPIFGQEEDAADVFSIFLIDALFEEDSAQALAYDAALGFWGEVVLSDAEGDEVAWWDTHGPDQQRFYNTVCLFYGANPDEREGFAEDMELPQDRAEYCEEEYELAADSWGAVLDAMTDRDDGHRIEALFDDDGNSLTARVLSGEIISLNADIRFDAPLRVTVESCGEANAYYDPSEQMITFCSEFEAHLREMFEAL